MHRREENKINFNMSFPGANYSIGYKNTAVPAL